MRPTFCIYEHCCYITSYIRVVHAQLWLLWHMVYTWYTGTAVHGTMLPSAPRDCYTPQFLPSIMRARTRVSATAVSYCEYLVLKVYNNSSITQSSAESSS